MDSNCWWNSRNGVPSETTFCQWKDFKLLTSIWLWWFSFSSRFHSCLSLLPPPFCFWWKLLLFLFMVFLFFSFLFVCISLLLYSLLLFFISSFFFLLILFPVYFFLLLFLVNISCKEIYYLLFFLWR